MNLNVAMIGPRGCGKTSVLSIMLGEIENFINKLNTDKEVKKHCNPKIQAPGMAIEILKLAYADLRNVAARNVLQDGVNILLPGAQHSVHNIDLTVSGITTTLSFHDFPGAYFLPEYHQRMVDADLQKMNKAFNTADVIVLCVDVPSQITYPPKDKNLVARDTSYVNYITSLIKTSLQKRSPNNLKKTVLVLPIKSEGEILNTVPDPIIGGYRQYIDPGKNDNLYQKVKNLYKDLFDYLKDESSVDSFYVPVITMGCVKAAGVEYDHELGMSRIRFEPVVKGPLNYYQCNSSALLALCLWSAEAVITQQYVDNITLFGRLKHLFSGKYPTEYFRDELFEECSLQRLRLEYLLRQQEPDSLSAEEKSNYETIKKAVEQLPFNGCRWI